MLLGHAPALDSAQATAGVRLAGFECGRIVQPDLGRFNDTMRFVGERREFAAGCFVVRHPKGVLLWDTGISRAMAERSQGRMTFVAPIADRLKALGLAPADVTHVAISHAHADHTGDTASFGGAELLIGAGDWETVQRLGADDPQRAAFSPWLTNGARVTPVSGDRDIFGDGSVMMLRMPGHTAGHSALLVRLPNAGAVLVSGDQYHFRENRAVRGVPTFNADRADTLASHDRFETIAANLKARVVIQHDPRDLAALPRFPQMLD
ncbi:N-acyl homoserine lactonase family protein [Sphingomonas baiyangensis]|uniref:N-acyl homoserine lactonase family protein n=1 Tax=Sphingomonas baiyangensis TaxID=2572576 RepID=A0A4U1L1L6_9SPHN|nr:N-acyl homoserine lactonase family protein [Sphingomonas baiyangensis]TKD50731.1 N-acyl homoserine lactonase family protein [Sphingomonas baiyangensis]